MDIRRILIIKDVVYAEGGLAARAPVTRVAACAVIANPLAGRAEDDLAVLVPLGAELGERLVRDALTCPCSKLNLARLETGQAAYGPADLMRLDAHSDDASHRPPGRQ